MEPQKILIDNRQKKKVATDSIRQKTRQILNALDCNSHEISIVLTDDEEIQRLNSSFRGIDRPTNVLSFAMQEGRFSDINPGLLGDVVISCDTAVREADDAGITLSERLTQLLIHGILHLIGFDHEISQTDAQVMEDRSLELLKQIESNPELKAF